MKIFMLRAGWISGNLVKAGVAENMSGAYYLCRHAASSASREECVESDFTVATPKKHIQTKGQSKRKILERKLITFPVQCSLMTWKGRTQLLKLAKEYTNNDLDLSFLASKFPVSESGIRKMLRTWKSHHVHSISKTLQHNSNVLNRWTLLSIFLSSFVNGPVEDFIIINEMIKSLPTDSLWILEESKLHLLAYAHGNPTLSFYTEEEKLPANTRDPVTNNGGSFSRLAVDFGDLPRMKNEELMVKLSSQQEIIERNIASFEALKEVREMPFHLPLSDSKSALRFHNHMQQCARLLFMKSRPPLKLPNRVELPFHKSFRVRNFWD
ncbi:hypothetical protein FGIG_09805 [Fasciola gigantica]|uniref:Uncharacterized protein n=1 Tax=Fasciola gigantica TaxID=46835 RepID=A0A504YKE2_FASGI|nr:hypothetical protein FGIG_09805 [Fasciola gigantica]